MSEFARALPIFRASTGLTQEGLATELGVTKSYISLVEKGDRELSKELEHKLVWMIQTKHFDSLSDLPPPLSKRIWEESDGRLEWIQRLLNATNARTAHKMTDGEEKLLVGTLLERIRPPDEDSIREAIDWIRRSAQSANVRPQEAEGIAKQELIQDVDQLLREMEIFKAHETCAAYDIHKPESIQILGDAVAFYGRYVAYLDSLQDHGGDAFVLCDRPFLHATADFREKLSLQNTEGTRAMHHYLRALERFGKSNTAMLRFFFNPMRSVEMTFWYAHKEGKDPNTESQTTHNEFAQTLQSLPALRYYSLPDPWLSMTGWKMSIFLLNTQDFKHTILFGYSPRFSKTFEIGTQIASKDIYERIHSILTKHEARLLSDAESLAMGTNDILLKQLAEAKQAHMGMRAGKTLFDKGN